MEQKDKRDIRRSADDETRTFEPHPVKISVEEFGPWILERDRKVFEMLEEYDRRQKRRKDHQR